MADEGRVPAVTIDEPAGGDHAAATRSGDAPARGKRKSSEPKAVAFKLMPPSYAAEVLAAASSALGPQPPADRPAQLTVWRRAADDVLKRAWKALDAVKQNDVLQRFPLERPVPFKDAPKAWIRARLHAGRPSAQDCTLDDRRVTALSPALPAPASRSTPSPRSARCASTHPADGRTIVANRSPPPPGHGGLVDVARVPRGAPRVARAAAGITLKLLHASMPRALEPR